MPPIPFYSIMHSILHSISFDMHLPRGQPTIPGSAVRTAFCRFSGEVDTRVNHHHSHLFFFSFCHHVLPTISQFFCLYDSSFHASWWSTHMMSTRDLRVDTPTTTASTPALPCPRHRVFCLDMSVLSFFFVIIRGLRAGHLVLSVRYGLVSRNVLFTTGNFWGVY